MDHQVNVAKKQYYNIACMMELGKQCLLEKRNNFETANIREDSLHESRQNQLYTMYSNLTASTHILCSSSNLQ